MKGVPKADIIAKLSKFRMVDKYRTFYSIQPYALFFGDDQRDKVDDMLNDCCRGLIKLYKEKEGRKKPTKTSLKKVCIACMDQITDAPISTESREFAYELCWYLSEIVEVDLLKTSARRRWGFRNAVKLK